MQYERQLNTAVARLDESLTHLYNLIAKGKQQEALQWMKEGDLKDKFEELQNIITISSTGNFGARGVQNTRPL
tara:strand:+ start:721 stop:939 length:219 start_codon:yes stop_codon:yes gene_type:complete